MAKKNIKFKAPKSAWEKGGLITAVVSGVLLWILANKLLTLGVDYSVHFTASMPVKAITMFWIALPAFHVGLMILITRSIVIGGTKAKIDWTFGLLATFGLFMVVISTIAGIYFGQEAIPWLFDIRQITLFRIGFIIEAIALAYFGFTE